MQNCFFQEKVNLNIQVQHCKPSSFTGTFNVEDPEQISSDLYAHPGLATTWPPRPDPPENEPQDPTFILLTGEKERWSRVKLMKEFFTDSTEMSQPIPQEAVCNVKKRVYKSIILSNCVGEGVENLSVAYSLGASEFRKYVKMGPSKPPPPMPFNPNDQSTLPHLSAIRIIESNL